MARMTSLAFPARRVLRVVLKPSVYLPDFITSWSLDPIESAPFLAAFCEAFAMVTENVPSQRNYAPGRKRAGREGARRGWHAGREALCTGGLTWVASECITKRPPPAGLCKTQRRNRRSRPEGSWVSGVHKGGHSVCRAPHARVGRFGGRVGVPGVVLVGPRVTKTVAQLMPSFVTDQDPHRPGMPPTSDALLRPPGEGQDAALTRLAVEYTNMVSPTARHRFRRASLVRRWAGEKTRALRPCGLPLRQSALPCDSYHPFHSPQSSRFALSKDQMVHYDKQYAQLYFVRLMAMAKRTRAAAEVRVRYFASAPRQTRRTDIGDPHVAVPSPPAGQVAGGALSEDFACQRGRGVRGHRHGVQERQAPAQPHRDIHQGQVRRDKSRQRGSRTWLMQASTALRRPRRRLREAVEDVRFASRADTLILEDEGARMALGCARAGALPARALSTGVVCAVRGRDRDGTFLVEDMCFPGLGPQRPLTRVPGSPMVALVSGLGLSRDSNLMLAQQLVDWVSGNLGSPEDQARASRVCRVVIVGGTVVGAAKLAERREGVRGRAADAEALPSVHDGRAFLQRLEDQMDAEAGGGADGADDGAADGAGAMDVDMNGHNGTEEVRRVMRSFKSSPPDLDGGCQATLSNASVSPTAAARVSLQEGEGDGAEGGDDARPAVQVDYRPVVVADRILTELAAAIPVDVMPGRGDPCTASLPQQPMHRCLLPGLAGFPASGVTRATNPHEFTLGGVRVLGTSGQNINDLWRYTEIDSGLALMTATLLWGHLAPTAPDTLPCFPFLDGDPFVLDEAPHIYFAGDQPRFQTTMVEGAQGQRVRVLMVPRFDRTGQLVLVDLNTLEPEVVQFGTLLR